MKRKMIGAASAYMAGLFFASFFNGIIVLLLSILFGILIFLFGKMYAFSGKDFAMMVAFFLLSSGISAYRTNSAEKLVSSYENNTMSFCGTVIDIRNYENDRVQYILEGKSKGNKSITVSLYTNDVNADYGDEISAEECTFTKPESDYLFDAESYYKSLGVALSLDSPKGLNVEHRDNKRIKKKLTAYREKLISEFRIKLGNKEGSFLAGMVLGEKQSLDEKTKSSLYHIGIGHILAVSGLHISIIAFLIMKICSLIRLKPMLSLIATDIILVIMILFANSPVSAVRAAIMMNFILAAKVFRRQNDTLNSLSAAVLIIGLIDPDCIYSSGFVMSVAGTFGIGVFGSYMTENTPNKTIIQRLTKNFMVMLCTSAFIMPFSMRFFGETSLIAPLTNILLVPLCSAALVLGVLYVVSFGFLPVLPIAGIVIRCVLTVSETIDEIADICLSGCGEGVAYTAFFALGIVMLIYMIFRSRFVTAIAAASGCFCVMLNAAVYNVRFSKTFTVAVLGKGKDAAVVVNYNGYTEIIDLSGNYKLPEYVQKYFTENSISKVQNITLTSKAHSQYSAYRSVLDDTDRSNWIFDSSISVSANNRIICLDKGGYSVENLGHKTEYFMGILTVEYAECKVVFAPAKSENADVPQADYLILYGNIPKERTNFDCENVVYLDKKEEKSINNFEIQISPTGDTKIRRL